MMMILCILYDNRNLFEFQAAAKNGHTALHIAARKNQMETAAALMERGAVVDAESRAGCTPLHLAAHQVMKIRFFRFIRNE